VPPKFLYEPTIDESANNNTHIMMYDDGATKNYWRERERERERDLQIAKTGTMYGNANTGRVVGFIHNSDAINTDTPITTTMTVTHSTY
jgi:hypothetical protein